MSARDEVGEAIVHVREYTGNDPIALEYWARMLAAEVARLRKIEHAACAYRDAHRRGRPYEVIEAYEYDLDRALGHDDAATGTTHP